MWIVLDKNKRPLGHCSEKSARKLFGERRACIYRYYPQVLILMDADVRVIMPSHHYRIKIDPGAVTTGITVVEDDRVILFMQVEHRARQVVDNLTTRRNARRNRRSRETRYRRCKYARAGNFQTQRPEGWLPPSQLSIVGNVVTMVNRLIRYLGPCDVSIESIKFDTQLMDDPSIDGKDYQHGTLYGYELKEYLKECYAHTCQYCGGETNDHRLEWEHMIPKSRGGSDSIKNATLACATCNRDKGNRTPAEWLDELQCQRSSELQRQRIVHLEKILSGKIGATPYRYAAWANITRWKVVNRIRDTKGVRSIELSTGGRTAFNRHNLRLSKDHHIDALCVGHTISQSGFRNTGQQVLYVKAMGRGTRLRGKLNKCGIIVTKWRDRAKRYNSLQTGDIVHVEIPNGKYVGAYTGRVKIRKSGSHDVTSKQFGLVTGTQKSVYIIRQRADGYNYVYATA